jgi:hypothetical protein
MKKGSVGSVASLMRVNPPEAQSNLGVGKPWECASGCHGRGVEFFWGHLKLTYPVGMINLEMECEGVKGIGPSHAE